MKLLSILLTVIPLMFLGCEKIDEDSNPVIIEKSYQQLNKTGHRICIYPEELYYLILIDSTGETPYDVDTAFAIDDNTLYVKVK